MKTAETMEWHLSTIFQGSQPNSRYDLLILNQPLNIQAYKRVARHGMHAINHQPPAVGNPAY